MNFIAKLKQNLSSLISGDKLGENAPHSGRGEPLPREQGPHPEAVLGAGHAAGQPRQRGQEPPLPEEHRLRQRAQETSRAAHPSHRVPDGHFELRPDRPR